MVTTAGAGATLSATERRPLRRLTAGGAAEHPLWYLNLRANPLAYVTVGRETRKVCARDAVGEEREGLWRALTDAYAGYDKYAQRTSRRIPVVVLELVSAGSRR
jgi:deazaflavin-dependent oxidoreductase (nitroreductase family)